jgi:hypothetical protein
MSHCDDRTAILNGFQVALGTTDPVVLLQTAEAGAYGRDPSVAARAAAIAIITSLGYRLSSYSNSVQGNFVSLVLGQLASLRYLTTGPTLQNPRGNYYSWSKLDFGRFRRREREHFPCAAKYGTEFLYCLGLAGT